MALDIWFPPSFKVTSRKVANIFVLSLCKEFFYKVFKLFFKVMIYKVKFLVCHSVFSNEFQVANVTETNFDIICSVVSSIILRDDIPLLASHIVGVQGLNVALGALRLKHWHVYLLQNRFDLIPVFGTFDSIIFSPQIRCSLDKIQVKRVLGIKCKDFWKGREVVKELSDGVVEQLLPGEPGPGHAVIEVVRLLLDDQLVDSLQSLQGLGARESQSLLLEAGVLDVLGGGEWRLGEGALKHVPGPLQSVLNGVGEIFKCTDGNRFLGGILRG